MKSGEPAKRCGTCSVCEGSITYYPRRGDDVVPRSCAVDEADRWSHDVIGDWIERPHRARPRGVVAAGASGSGSSAVSVVGGRRS